MAFPWPSCSLDWGPCSNRAPPLPAPPPQDRTATVLQAPFPPTHSLRVLSTHSSPPCWQKKDFKDRLWRNGPRSYPRTLMSCGNTQRVSLIATPPPSSVTLMLFWDECLISANCLGESSTGESSHLLPRCPEGGTETLREKWSPQEAPRDLPKVSLCISSFNRLSSEG